MCLALGRGLPERFKQNDSQGVELQEDTIIGDELGPIIRAALNHRCGKSLDEIEYRKYFKLYFEYGCLCLKRLWEECGEDQSIFISKLLKEAMLFEYNEGDTETINTKSIVNDPVSLKILKNEDPWIINSSGGNGLIVISGKPGRGKSQLALDLLAQAARQGVRFLFFDLKGELEENEDNKQQIENRQNFLNSTGARYTRLITSGLPINPLFKTDNDTVNAQISSEFASLVRSFAPQLSASQERTIRNAFDNIDNPDFINLAEELETQGETGEGYSIIEKIARFKIFSASEKAISIEEWLSNSQIIDFKPLGNDKETKALAVAFILNTIMKQLAQSLPIVNGIQPLQMILFVDEAHLLLPKEGKSGLLGSLARQGRAWGFPVWLASQDADAFLTTGDNATDFAELADCGVHFSPQVLSEKQQRSILGQIFSKLLNKGEAVLRLHEKSKSGEVYQFYQNHGR